VKCGIRLGAGVKDGKWEMKPAQNLCLTIYRIKPFAGA
jgi:hypothetical protein